MWQIGATGINQVNTGQVIFRCDLLGTQMFFDTQWVIRAPFDGGIIGNNHAGLTGNHADTADETSAGDVFVVDVPCGEL